MVRASIHSHGRSEVHERPSAVRALRREQQRLAARVRELRAARGWSQELAAERVGLSAKQFGALERGQANVTLATLVGCALAFRVELSELF